MIYFEDLRPVMNVLDDSQLGRFLRAVVSYADSGEVMDLDMPERLAFELYVPRIDRDGAALRRKQLHGRYMTYCRSVDEENRMSESEWIAAQETGSNY